jgi:hypothetical protein
MARASRRRRHDGELARRELGRCRSRAQFRANALELAGVRQLTSPTTMTHAGRAGSSGRARNGGPSSRERAFVYVASPAASSSFKNIPLSALNWPMNGPAAMAGDGPREGSRAWRRQQHCRFRTDRKCVRRPLSA